MLIEIKDIQDPRTVLVIDDEDPNGLDALAVTLESNRGYGWFSRSDILRALIALGEREVD